MWATFVNGVLGIVMMITFCFAVGGGDNLEQVLDSNIGIPVIQLLYNVTASKAGTVVMSVVLLILQYFSAITTIASSSRQTWAFARDKGFPFSNWLSYVGGLVAVGNELSANPRADPARVGSPTQLTCSVCCSHLHSWMHQLWLRRCVGCHHVRFELGSSILLHCLYWVRTTQEMAWRAFTSSIFLTRQVRRGHQRCSAGVFASGVRLLSLPERRQD